MVNRLTALIVEQIMKLLIALYLITIAKREKSR